MTILNLRIPDNLAGRLSHLAEVTGRTKSYYVRQALEERLAELEDFYLAVQALENAKSGKSKIWSQEDIEKGRDLEN